MHLHFHVGPCPNTKAKQLLYITHKYKRFIKYVLFSHRLPVKPCVQIQVTPFALASQIP